VFYGLNAVRALSIVCLLLASASSIVTIVPDIRAVNKLQDDANFNQGACGYVGGSNVPDQPAGVFWAVLNRFFIIFELVFLLLSEISWPMVLFDRFFPVLGSDFGLGALGVFQARIGTTILSHHVGKFELVIAFLLLFTGCLNIALGLESREKAKAKRSIHAWRHGTSDDDAKGTPHLVARQLAADAPSSGGLGFGRQGREVSWPESAGLP